MKSQGHTGSQLPMGLNCLFRPDWGPGGRGGERKGAIDELMIRGTFEHLIQNTKLKAVPLTLTCSSNLEGANL